MPAEVGTAYVKLKGDFSGLSREVAARVSPMAKDFSGRFGKAMGPVMAQQSKHLHTFTQAAKYATVGAAGLAAYGFKDVVEAGAQFEKQMSTNAAVSEANRKQMEKLERQSIKLGKATFFSANEAGQAQAELLKGGLKIQQVLGGGLPAALSLAEAGELDLAVAAETTVNAMKLFGLSGKDASTVADMLSTAANRTTADVLDFAMALKQGGSVTKLAGYDMNETVTILEALAEAGIKNSDAGTSMKAATINLLKPSTKQAELAKELNLEWVAQNGHLKSGAEISEELRRATDGMTKAERAKVLATLAGTDGVRTLNALYAEGPEKLRALEQANAKQGTAQEIAAKKMDNFAGLWEQFKGSLETTEIQIYKGMEPALSDLAEEATHAANEVGAVFDDPRLSGGQKIEGAFDVLSQELEGAWDRHDVTEHVVDIMDAAVPVVAEQAGHLGFEAAKGFGKGFIHADLLGKAVMGAWLAHFIGGNAPFIAVGKSMAGRFSASFAAQAGEQSVYELARSFGRGRGSSALAQSGAFAQSAAVAAQSFAGSFARYAGPALATVGVANIATSAISGDWKDAGFEAGGALAGGVAGFFLSGGNPLGAMLGVGLGSIGGELGADLFGGIFDSGKHLAPIQQRLAAESKHVAEAFRSQRGAVKSLALAHSNLQVAEQRQKTSTGAVHRAEARLSADRKRYGADSNRVKRDELLLAEAKRKNAAATKEVNQAHRLSGPALKLFNHLTVEAAASTKIHIVDLKRSFRAAYQKFKQDESNASAAKRAQRILGELTGEQRKLSRLYEEAGSKSGARLQKRIETLTLSQAEFGSKLQGISRLLPDFGAKSKHWVADAGGGAWLDYQGNVHQATKLASQDAVSMNTTSQEAMVSLAETASKLLKGFGVDSGANFHVVKGGKEQHRRDGGFVVPGTGSGDSFHTALSPEWFILNREATSAYGFNRGGKVPVALEPGERAFSPPEVKALGGSGVMEAMNRAVPRFGFQQGGALGPEPQLIGPAGALRSLGQAAIHEVFEGGQDYLRKHMGPRPGLGTMDGKPVSAWIIPILQWARQHGWDGSVTSGFRTAAEQIAAATGYGLEHYGAAGPLGSNHVRVNYPGGAVDVTLAAQLDAILKGYPDKPNLVWGGPVMGDYVHFSATGHQRGGLVQAFAKGGLVDLVGSHWDNDELATLAHVVEMRDPGVMAQKAQGESSGNERAIGHDPSGKTEGLGLWQITTKYNDALIAKYGGRTAMLSALPNAKAAKEILDSQGMGAWYAPAVGPVGRVDSELATQMRAVAAGKSVDSDEHSFKEDIPAVYHGARTSSVDFPSIPKSLSGVNKEIARWEGEIKRYRRAAKQADEENKPAIAQALQKNITAINHFLMQLRNARVKLRFEKAKKKFSKGLSKRLGKVTGYETMIEGLQRDYNIANQRAEQIVGLEPQQAELPASATDAQREAAEKDYVARFADYVNSRERPAYADVIGKEARWRNAILRAEYFGFGKDKPSVVKLEHNWEGQIRQGEAVMEHIKTFTEKVAERVAAWRKDHSGDLPKWLKDQIKERDDLRDKLPWLRFKDTELRKVLGEGRAEFYPGMKHPILRPTPPLAGTGTLEGHLEEVQGIHWPDQHSLMDPLPEKRVEGMFGGAIWETQTAIEELGLKINQASSGLGGGGTGGSEDTDNSDQEELTRQANQRAAISEAQRVALVGWDRMRQGLLDKLPRFHDGGRIMGSPHQEVPIMAKVGETVLSEGEAELVRRSVAGDSDGEPIIVINGDIVQEKGDTRDPVELVLGDRRFAPAVQKAARVGRGTGILTPGGARR